ncbi:MAG TPA: hypothetical protein VOA80_19565 [Thermoanaerobaculia bacterium]|nr:hypothetical protein [Thermoanaerobaculia bacterium]
MNVLADPEVLRVPCGRKALVPVSLFNSRSSSEEALNLVERLAESFDHVVIFIADGLQVYNEARDKSSAVLNDNPIDLRVQEFCVRARGVAPPGKLEVCGVDSLTDRAFFRIYRRLAILRYVDPNFGAAISKAADLYCRYQHLASNAARELSAAYLLEEAALNLRLRVVDKIEAEFYMGGRLPKPLVNLYRGKYMASVFELTDTPPSPIDFLFFELRSEGEGKGRLTRVS